MIHIAYFSPTHTSRSVARAVAEGMSSMPCAEIDLTHCVAGEEVLSPDARLVVAMPVWGGALPPLAVERIKGLRGTNTPVVAIVLYGNRDFEGAASQLCSLLRLQGFNPVCVAAFVGEHSFSTAEYPIAPGRPSLADMDEAREMGRRVAEKLLSSCETVEDKALKAPSYPMEKVKFLMKAAPRIKTIRAEAAKAYPVTDIERCVSCGACVRACPVEAIPMDQPLMTDTSRCVRCAACVKACPHDARSITTPFSSLLSTTFKKAKPNVYII